MDGNNSLLIWFMFAVIAVSDAREHRISNASLFLIVMVSFIDILSTPEPLTSLSWSVISFLTLFLIGLSAYFLGALAPGDVKLLGVVGFVVGWGSLYETICWILISGVLVGIFYLASFIATRTDYLQYLYQKVLFKSPVEKTDLFDSNEVSKMYMPFGPVVVIGIAMSRYFI
ncbi:prepilin peptidase [Vibrio maerlii]|uniref:prepilin peptidase n=1 Tax=Vibrio maerlii TaxID=2231648 RepID=UPI000E3BD4A9|nr:A24 family peptidase [Vibrio maerlii]